MYRQLVLVFLVASAGVDQCNSFKQVRRKLFPPGCHPHCKYQRNYLHSANTLSIRGGSDYIDENEGDEDDDSIYDFIASFESELAEIRREAEMEAANEMQKLRELIEQRANGIEEEDETDTEDYETVDAPKENGMVPVDAVEEEKAEDYGNIDDGSREVDGAHEYDKNVPVDVVEEEEETEDYSNIDDGSTKADDKHIPDIIIYEDTDVTIDEEAEASSDEELTEATDQLEIESDEALPDDGRTTEEIDKSESESDVGDGQREEIIIVEDDDYLEYDEFEPEVGDSSAEADSENVATTSDVDVTIDDDKTTIAELDEDIKPKKPKKKRKKLSKKGKRKMTRTNALEESELSDVGRVDSGESVMLTTQSQNVEVSQPTGLSKIWSILRSDLGRALTLFIATVAIAILTQRLQRQMMEEAEAK